MADFIDQLPARVRNDPLGPVTLNQAQANIATVDGLSLIEHFIDGQHNAQEVPWVLGHVGSSTTGYMFDTAYGGGTIARPGTGVATLSVVSGVIGSAYLGADLTSAASILANPSDSNVASKPHVAIASVISDTSVAVSILALTSSLGSGNSWALAARAFDVAIHAQKQPADASELIDATIKLRRDFLTNSATDWNALARNQGTLRARMGLEHDSDGEHSVARIAKAVGWFRPSGGTYVDTSSVGVSSVSKPGTGICEVTVSTTFSDTNHAACFPQAQASDDDELVIVNGYCTATNKFTFYIYVFDPIESKWARADRPFFAVMHGTP